MNERWHLVAVVVFVLSLLCIEYIAVGAQVDTTLFRQSQGTYSHDLMEYLERCQVSPTDAARIYTLADCRPKCVMFMKEYSCSCIQECIQR